ncbi:BspA family leucine-rich repeat surface protein, partial [Bathymodiolus thermophilus thioautotrophic gill symbiont]
MQVETPKQVATLQTKAQKIATQLNQEVITTTPGKQHIQVQAGTVYQLNTEDFNTNKLNLIAKKIGGDLEVTLEDSVIIFDNYFEVCTTDLSCLVSLPAEDGGLYHIVADVFFTLEDGTQIVYFYGEQSIIATESSAVSADDNQSSKDVVTSFEDMITANMGIVAAVAAVAIAAVVVGSGSDSGSGSGGGGGDNENKTLITGDVNLGLVTSNSLKIQAFVDGTAISEKFVVDDNGKFTITLNKLYSQGTIVTLELTDTTTTADYINEASGIAEDLNSDLKAIIVIQSNNTKINITPLTDIAAKIMDKETSLTEELVASINAQVGEVFNIFGDVTTEMVKTVINNKGEVVAGNAYGKALAIVSYFEKNAKEHNNTISTSDINKDIADAIDIVNANTSTTKVNIADNNMRMELRKAEAMADIRYDMVPNDHFNNLQAIEVMPVIATVATDDVINFSEKDNTSITGTVKAGSTVVLSINGRDKNASVSGTTWHYTLTNADITAIEGKTVSIIATATDADKKVTLSNTKVITVDTTVPTFELSLPTIINIATNTPITTPVYDAQAINLKGGNADDGITYSLKEATSSKFKINADTGKVTYKTLQTSAHNNDMATIIATDNAGNTTEQLITVSVQDIGLTTSIVWGNISNNDNIIGTSDLTTVTLSGTVFVTGTVDSISIASIVFKKNGNTVHEINTNLPNVDNNNTWTLTHDDTWASKLINGDYTIVVNLSGNSDSTTIEGSGTLTTTIDTIAPTQPTVALTNSTNNTPNITKDGAVAISVLEVNGTRTYHLKKGDVEVTNVTNEESYIAYMANADEATYTLAITDIDNAGNISIRSNTLTFTLSHTPPSSPIVTLQKDSGLTSDHITNNGQLTVTDVSDDDTITYIVTKDSEEPLATMTAAEYIAYITGDNKDGNYSVLVVVTNTVGNTSNAIKTFTLDTNSPTPVFKLTDTGSSDNDDITNNNTITVEKLEPGATWQYSVDGGTNFIDGTGHSFTLDEGTYAKNAIQIKQTDIAGNVSSIAENTATIIVDTTGPVFTSTTTVQVEINTAISEIIYTAVATDDTPVTYTLDGNQNNKFTIKHDTGELKYQEKQTQIENHNVTIVATDSAGNETRQVVKVLATDIGLSTSVTWNNIGDDNYINSSELATATLSGTVNIIGTITNLSITSIVFKQKDTDSTYTLDSNLPNIITSADNSTWTLANNAAWTSQLNDGSYTVTVNLAGNNNNSNSNNNNNNGNNGSVTGQGVTTTAVTIDTVAPATPTFNFTDTGLNDDNITNNGKLPVTNASNDDTVTYLVTKNNESPIALTVEEYDTYITGSNKDGDYSVEVVITDTVGNTSQVTKTFTLNTAPPATPILAFTDTGSSSDDGITKNGELPVINTSNNTSITYLVTKDDADPVAMTIEAYNTYIAENNRDGNYSVTIVATSIVGNTSSITKTFTLDTTPPETPVFTFTDTGLLANDNITKNGKLSVTNASNDNTITYLVTKNNEDPLTMTAEEYNTYITGDNKDGNYSVTIITTDIAGNTSNVTKTFTLDTTPLAAPTLTFTDTGLNNDGITNNGRLTVTNVANDATLTYIVTKNNGTPLATMTAAEYTTYITTSNKDGNYSVKVVVTDIAGNTSDATQAFTLNTTPPTAPTVNTLITNNTTPIITGTTGTNAALATGESLSVTISGATYSAIPNDQGIWHIDLSTPATNGTLIQLTDGNYSVVATVTNLVGNSINDTSHNEITIDSSVATVSTVVITATNATGTAKTSTLGIGDKIVVTLTMDEAVVVTGTPTYTINIGGVEKTATYTSSPSSTTLVFNYTIVSGDSNPTGNITAGVDALLLAGGTLKNNIGYNASLTTPAITNDSMQWAKTTVASSQWSLDSYSDNKVEGAPDTGLNVGDSQAEHKNAWAENTGDRAKANTLILTYDQSVYIKDIIVRETYSAGTISKVEVMREGVFVIVYAKSNGAETGGIMSGVVEGQVSDTKISLNNKLDYSSNTIRLTVGDSTDVFNEIDAVQLLGTAIGLVVNTVAPQVDTLITNNTLPIITGTMGTNAALATGESLSVTISGATYNTVPNSNGVWRVDLNINPISGTLTALTDGDYSVVATITDAAGNKITDTSNNEIHIDTQAPTLTIIGSGGTGGSEVTFNFSEAIQDGSFTIDDIIIVNGIITPDSLTKISATQYSIIVTPSLGGQHDNIAITIAANTLVDLAGNTNITAKNTTKLFQLSNHIDIDGNGFDVDLTNWDVSHADSAIQAFFNATTFKQDIGHWNVGNVVNMQSMFLNATSFNQDIGNWNVGNVVNMNRMFENATAFNQDIGFWNVSSVTNMYRMFAFKSTFNQDLGSWDVSSLTNGQDMFKHSAITVANMDNTLRGWARLDTAAGETALQNNVVWGIADYTDATARQYLIDTYNWNINADTFDDKKTIQGSNTQNDTLSTTSAKTTIHGLGGNDNLNGGATNDILIGGAGNDILTGGAGNDTFDYGFTNAGNDWIKDFTMGTSDNADVIDLKDLLIGYSATSNLSDFVTASAANSTANDIFTRLVIDHDGTGAEDILVTITLEGIEYNTDLLNNMVANGNLIFESIRPTLTITGSSGKYTSNTITFNFSEAIKDGSFTIGDIDIINGTLNANSFTKISATQYSVIVIPSLGGEHANVAIIVGANTFADIAGNTNATLTSNTTTISNLKNWFNINSSSSDVDLTHWDVSYASDASYAFYRATTFDQNIGKWQMGSATNMYKMFAYASAFNQDIGNWQVDQVAHMSEMFLSASVFNKDIGNWDTGKVSSMYRMFFDAYAFNQDIGNWDISSLTNANHMFTNTLAMTSANMDNTLRGWARLDSATGETAIQRNVVWSIANYTDATARQYLINTYNWTIKVGTFDGSKTIQGSATANTLTTTSIKTTLHGLGGNDILIGGTTDDTLVGGAGDDTLTGGNGNDTFDYGFKNAGNDTITDFTVGNIRTNANADTIDLSDLLIGCKSTSYLSDFITATAAGTGTKLTINYGGTEALNALVTITLSNVAYNANLLNNMAANGNLILESIGPALIITGNGGRDTASNTITFNFNEAIKDGSFTAYDVSVVNGVINAGSMTKVSANQYTMTVTPSPSGQHANVAITVAAGTFEDLAGNVNTAIAKNTTEISDLKDWLNVNSNNLTDLDVSHANNASNAFIGTSFNQDIGNWDVSKITGMLQMFRGASTFNQNISNWDVSKVISMHAMFNAASAFNQNISNWDISNLEYAEWMLDDTAISIDNMDNILRGWAKLDTSTGESAIQRNVIWGIAQYTDATAKQYLIDTYNWTINMGSFDRYIATQGTAASNTLNTTSTKTILHGLGGNDTLIGGTTNDTLVGGSGDDTLTGAGGRDIFDYGFENAGNDTITDFTVGNINTNTSADVIDLSNLLIGYSTTSNLNAFVTAAATTNTVGTKLTIDHDGTGTLNSPVTITLKNITYNTHLLNDLIANGNLVLDAAGPTLLISGSGGKDSAANTITFNFSKAIKDGSFTVADIDIINGTINAGSLTKINETQYTIKVTPNLGGKHSNVAITVAAGAFADIVGNVNTAVAKNETRINYLAKWIDLESETSHSGYDNTDITMWDVSHVTDASDAFYDDNLRQDIGGWDVSNVVNMSRMFKFSHFANENFSSWDVSKVVNMFEMFYSAHDVNQNFGSWDISSLTNADHMFLKNEDMNVTNMDNTLRGWAKLDAAAGETTIQNDVEWGITNYTDATARQYLINTYNWTINDGTFDGSKTIQGTATSNTFATTSTKTTLHGLGGNDTLIGGTTDDILVGGAGNDTLIGEGGRDTFDYGFENAGNDLIGDFTVGDINTNADADIVDLKDLLIGYESTSNLSDFITATADGASTKLTIDHDGAGELNSPVTIILGNIAYRANLLDDMIANGNLVLGTVKPILTITGSGGRHAFNKIITFNFNETIGYGSFTVDDIDIVNGTIDLGSFTRVSATQYTIKVTPSLGGMHNNVAITVAANTFTDSAGNANTVITKNATRLFNLGEHVGADTDLTNWDVSHVSSTFAAFYEAYNFNQNIDKWDVSNMINAESMFYGATTFNQDIGSWDVGRMTNTKNMFSGTVSFNQDIDSWDVSKLTTAKWMFYEATAFNQNLGSWDISSLTDAEGMFVTTSMTTANMDNTLRGWAKLDIVAGEAAIQRDVAWDIANYTDATAKQYLIDTYNWTIEAVTYDSVNRIKVDFDGFDGSKTIQGSNTQSDTLFTTSAKTTIHGLGGNDNLNGGTTDDILIG